MDRCAVCKRTGAAHAGLVHAYSATPTVTDEERRRRNAAYHRKYREANKEQFAAYHRKYREANKEQLAANKRKYAARKKAELESLRAEVAALRKLAGMPQEAKERRDRDARCAPGGL